MYFSLPPGKSGNKWAETIKAVEAGSNNQKPKQQSLRKWIVRECQALGKKMVGHQLKVWWPQRQQYAMGIVQSFDPQTARHHLTYDNRKEEFLWLAIESYEDLGMQLSAAASLGYVNNTPVSSCT